MRTLAERFQEHYPETEVIAKRQRERTIRSLFEVQDVLQEDLTDRQWEALQTAYSAGYFDWPRESTAKEIANSLDLAPPTLHEHLRGALKELNETFFSETGEFSEDERLRPRE